MDFPGNEVAADNQRRRMEEVSRSPVDGAVESAIFVASPALAVGSALTANGTTSAMALTIAGGVVAGLGIVDWFRNLGNSKVNENIEALGRATEEALNRVESALQEHGTSIDEIKARIESPEFKEALASASLQALRTSQSKRIKRLANILANGVKDGDLEPEGLDDSMRAAVELGVTDVAVLRFISSSQIELVTSGYKDAIYGWPHAWLHEVQMRWQASLTNREQAFTQGDFDAGFWRSSLARLQAFGFIAPVQPNPTTNSPGEEPYGLLPRGQEFLNRLSEVFADGR